MSSLTYLLEGLTPGEFEVHGPSDRRIGAIRYDSRMVQPDDIYVAMNGRDDKGLLYASAAVSAGAGTILTDAPGELPEELSSRKDLTVIVVANARRAMAELSNRMYGYPTHKLSLLGVTGTNGKTTTTFLLRQLLETCGVPTGVIGTLGKMIGGNVVPTGYTTPESPELVEILDEMVRAEMNAVTMEVSSHALALDRVWGLRFRGAVFTNLTQDHLDFHDTMDEYLRAKKMLFDNLDADCPAVVNADDPATESLIADSRAAIYRYGESASADARIGDVRLDAGGSAWTLTLSEPLGGGVLELHTPIMGRFNIRNVTAAFALALALGYDRTTLLQAVTELQAVPGRMETIPLGNGATAVVDYAHTPDALENILLALREQRRGTGSVAVVFGCGGDRDRVKRPLMGAIAERLADTVVITSDNPRSESPDAIIAEVAAGMKNADAAVVITDRAEAIHHALRMATPGDIVLIAGKGHEDYQIIGSEKKHFDDREQVREFVREHNS